MGTGSEADADGGALHDEKNGDFRRGDAGVWGSNRTELKLSDRNDAKALATCDVMTPDRGDGVMLG